MVRTTGWGVTATCTITVRHWGQCAVVSIALLEDMACDAFSGPVWALPFGGMPIVGNEV